MNAEEFKSAIHVLEVRLTYSDLGPRLAKDLKTLWIKLDQHRLEMEAAEKPVGDVPRCGKCDAPMGNDIEPFCPVCHEMFTITKRGIAIENRLDKIDSRLDRHGRVLKDLFAERNAHAKRLAEIERKAKRMDIQLSYVSTCFRELYPSFVPTSVDATIAEAVSEHDEMLRKLAEIGDATNQPSEDPVHAEPLPPPDLPRWKPKVRLSDEQLRRMRDAECDDDNPPPAEVEMQLIQPPWQNAGWTWVTLLAGLHLHGSQGWPCEYFEHRQDAEENGNAWVTALGKQLGVPLVAKWVDGGVGAPTGA